MSKRWVDLSPPQSKMIWFSSLKKIVESEAPSVVNFFLKNTSANIAGNTKIAARHSPNMIGDYGLSLIIFYFIKPFVKDVCFNNLDHKYIVAYLLQKSTQWALLIRLEILLPRHRRHQHLFDKIAGFRNSQHSGVLI